MGLVAYGVVGLALLTLTAAGVAGPLGEITRLSTSIEAQRQSLTRALDTTALTLDNAGSGIGRLDDSLTQAHQSTTEAAQLARDVGDTMRQLSGAMNVQIFGQQPFVGVVGSFDTAAAQLTSLGGSIEGIGTALDANSADIAVTRGDLADLRTEVQGIVRTLRDGPSLQVPPGTIDGTRLILFGVMAWLALLSLGIALLGVALMARSRAR